MFYSDATRVAQFGQAKLWPIYVFFGNQSKYDRGRPSARAAHNLAFLPSVSFHSNTARFHKFDIAAPQLPPDLTDFIRKSTKNAPTPQLLAYCKRELYQGCWRVMLDQEFLEAYANGIVHLCSDEINRRLYPRIFIYSADYPEKFVSSNLEYQCRAKRMHRVLTITIREMGLYPSPRNLIPKSDFSKFGEAADMEARRTLMRIDTEERRKAVIAAREVIYEKGYAVTSDYVDEYLREGSLVPTLNAFSHPILASMALMFSNWSWLT
ncbi:hypothetical protein BDN72DRAFT_902894 [Pluteus cervinus]|uniref:Uncharacterized protein n=1 Tax=Pluteus cervinus TaxID=181527 RepID=A0ACD3ABQ3_9AGAR|nr:hypothetical protein BDN72DRAFT_902894 [Pluteus cervinus]